MRILLAVTAACLLGVTTASAEPFQCTAGRTIDGDTFNCTDATKVRLFGVNSPELPHFGRPGEPGANADRQWLDRTIKGVTLSCEPMGKSYDRIVAMCHLPDGSDVAELAVKAGVAQDCQKYSGGRYAAYEQPGVWRNHRMCGG